MSEAEDDDLPGPKRRQPYNRGACASCSNAKTRCIPLEGCSKCERCEKLNRECVRRTPIVRKRRLAPGTTTRVTDLENKLDSIVNLLSSNRKENFTDRTSSVSLSLRSGSLDGSPGSRPSPPSITSARAQEDAQMSRPPPSPKDRSTWTTEATPSMQPPCNILDEQPVLRELPSQENLAMGFSDINTAFRLYQTYCTPYFPFAIIPPDLTSLRLQNQNPFLLDVLSYCASPFKMEEQAMLGERLLSEIVQRLLIRPEKTSHLLLGLLLYTAWNYIMFPVNGQMTTLLHLTQSLIVNLQLERPPGAVNVRVLFMKGYINSQTVQAARETSPRTADERRALLGCYYLTSVKCLLSGSVALDSFEWNSYIDECCNDLAQSQQYPTDVLVTCMCRLQRIADGIVIAFPRPETPSKAGAVKVPSLLAIKALQSDLQAFQRSLPEEMKQQPLLMFNYYATEAFLYETILLEPLSDQGPLEKFNMLEMLNAGLVSIKAFFSLWRTFPHEHYAYLPFTVWIHAGLVMQIACKFVFFEYPGWDLPFVRQEVDILGTLNHEITGLHAVIAVRGSTEPARANKDIFHNFLKRKQFMKSAIEAKLAAEVAATQPAETTVTNPPASLPSIEDMYMGGLYHDFDDALWKDFGNWRYDTNFFGAGAIWPSIDATQVLQRSS